MRNHLRYLAAVLAALAIPLAAVLLLTGSPALATSQSACNDAYDSSSASNTCRSETISFGDYNNCLQCCLIFAECHTGQNPILYPNPWNNTTIAAPVSQFDDLNNCSGVLRVGNC